LHGAAWCCCRTMTADSCRKQDAQQSLSQQAVFITKVKRGLQPRRAQYLAWLDPASLVYHAQHAACWEHTATSGCCSL
jgi:hypothetical protein